MIRDYNLLMSLPVRDLLDRAKLATSGAEQLLRALADRLEDDTDHIANLEMELEQAKRDLEDAERRADNWQSEAMAFMAQMKGMVR
jgi:hypothetical protein